eukprot:scaffold676_cov273-Pinguiococcus_pyrenoidosus.AAC.3
MVLFSFVTRKVSGAPWKLDTLAIQGADVVYLCGLSDATPQLSQTLSLAAERNKASNGTKSRANQAAAGDCQLLALLTVERLSKVAESASKPECVMQRAMRRGIPACREAGTGARCSPDFRARTRSERRPQNASARRSDSGAPARFLLRCGEGRSWCDGDKSPHNDVDAQLARTIDVSS